MVLLGLAPPAASTPWELNGQPVAFVDNGMATSSFNINFSSCDEPLRDVNVSARWTHTFNGDVELRLRAPDGELALLIADHGGASDGGSVLFDDEAELPITNPPGMGTPALSGQRRPLEPLTVFEGLDPVGEWQLEVVDDDAGATGTLEGWELHLECLNDQADFLPAVVQPVPIPDDSSLEVFVPVAACDQVTDVDVEVVFQHQLVSDLTFELLHGGTSVMLWHVGVFNTRGGWLRFDDEASTPIAAIVPDASFPEPGTPWPLRGTYAPEAALNAFDGADGTGNWSLKMTDNAPQDIGEFQQFGVDLECADLPDPAPPPPPPPPPPGDDSVVPLFGAGRVQTAVAVSQSSFPAEDAADAAVLATEGNFADAMAGTPLAAAVEGPLLLTPPASLVSDTATELDRVLPDGATVYLLGGEGALSAAVAAAVDALGFDAQRLAGPTRFETAVAIAEELDDRNAATDTFVAEAFEFQAALVAGAVAAQEGAVVVLSNDDEDHDATTAYLASAGHPVTTIGSEAATAYPNETHVANVADPAAMSVAVADHFFPDAAADVGIANALTFPDALAGGAHIARQEGPLLLTAPQTLSPAVQMYLEGNAATFVRAFVYGGNAAVAEGVRDAVLNAITA